MFRPICCAFRCATTAVHRPIFMTGAEMPHHVGGSIGALTGNNAMVVGIGANAGLRLLPLCRATNGNFLASAIHRSRNVSTRSVPSAIGISPVRRSPGSTMKEGEGAAMVKEGVDPITGEMDAGK